VVVGLDTSVVLRLLTGLPQVEAERARSTLEQAFANDDRVVVTDLVVSEAYFALHHHYGLPKERARSLLLAFATSGVVEVDPPTLVAALHKRAGAGLMDRIIAARHEHQGATTLTFDRRRARLEGVRRL
jgi:predicted nucleic acid-binding protein